MVRSSFSILFFIRESKVRKNGNAPIEVIITINGEKCSFPTGKQVHIDKWDKTKQQVKGKDEEAKKPQQLPESRKSQTVSERSGNCWVEVYHHC
mgnify:CR=1 FL=1